MSSLLQLFGSSMASLGKQFVQIACDSLNLARGVMHGPRPPPQDHVTDIMPAYSSRDGNNREYKTWADRIFRSLSKKLDDIPSKVCKEVTKINSNSQKQLEEKTEEAHTLRSELELLKKRLQHEQRNFEEEVAVQAAKIKQLENDKKKLRNVILGRSGKQKISDEEIKQRFAILRQRMQALANSPAYDLMRTFHEYRATSQIEFDFQRLYNSYSPADRIFLIRAKIYEILYHYILDEKVFGLALALENAQNDRIMFLENALGDFEDFVQSNKVPNRAISDWRLATFHCIEALNAESKDATLARTEIWNCFRPLIKMGQETGKLKADIWQLCEGAFDLRLLTRKSDDRYYFESPRPETCFDPKHASIETCGVIGGGEKTDVVALPICGALVKYTGTEDSEGPCYLEPAHVLVKARDDGEGISLV